MVCGVSKVRRADTAQIFSVFGMELVVLALAASTTTRAEWARKEAARKAYVKRKELREAVCSVKSLRCGREAAGDKHAPVLKRGRRGREAPGGVAGAIAVGRRAGHKRRDVGPRRVPGG